LGLGGREESVCERIDKRGGGNDDRWAGLFLLVDFTKS
jgi:hypothetical protein